MNAEEEIKYLFTEIDRTDAKDFERLGELLIRIKKMGLGDIHEQYLKESLSDGITHKIEMIVLSYKSGEEGMKTFLKKLNDKEKERFIKVREHVQKVFDGLESDWRKK